MILDEHMAMLDHISSVCQRCYYQIRRARKSLSAASKLISILASVHSRLDNIVLHSVHWSRLSPARFVLNSTSRLIRGLGRFDH